MASIYDSIKTPRELLETVTIHGLSTATDDICRAQDIFGNAPLDNLVALATDNGRRNDKGEPDPNGSWSSGKQGMQSTFYMVLFHIWNWEDATRFYNQHSNPEYANLKKEAQTVKKLTETIELANRNNEILKSNAETMEQMLDAAKSENNSLQAKVAEQEAEIQKLKARLYDLMVERK